MLSERFFLGDLDCRFVDSLKKKRIKTSKNQTVIQPTRRRQCPSLGHLHALAGKSQKYYVAPFGLITTLLARLEI